MEFKENATVFSAQGDEVGRLERVVIERTVALEEDAKLEALPEYEE